MVTSCHTAVHTSTSAPHACATIWAICSLGSVVRFGFSASYTVLGVGQVALGPLGPLAQFGAGFLQDPGAVLERRAQFLPLAGGVGAGLGVPGRPAVGQALLGGLPAGDGVGQAAGDLLPFPGGISADLVQGRAHRGQAAPRTCSRPTRRWSCPSVPRRRPCSTQRTSAKSRRRVGSAETATVVAVAATYTIEIPVTGCALVPITLVTVIGTPVSSNTSCFAVTTTVAAAGVLAVTTTVAAAGVLAVTTTVAAAALAATTTVAAAGVLAVTTTVAAAGVLAVTTTVAAAGVLAVTTTVAAAGVLAVTTTVAAAGVLAVTTTVAAAGVLAVTTTVAAAGVLAPGP